MAPARSANVGVSNGVSAPRAIVFTGNWNAYR
jgi:hypothetical protein